MLIHTVTSYIPYTPHMAIILYVAGIGHTDCITMYLVSILTLLSCILLLPRPINVEFDTEPFSQENGGAESVGRLRQMPW
ncbi:hypothetical protein EV401DRAFT_1906671, partial [Pisolithus croceorrhizus]